jgi:hypothetical protein
LQAGVRDRRTYSTEVQQQPCIHAVTGSRRHLANLDQPTKVQHCLSFGTKGACPIRARSGRRRRSLPVTDGLPDKPPELPWRTLAPRRRRPDKEEVIPAAYCCQHCSQDDRQEPIPGDGSGTTTEVAVTDGRRWTVRPLLRIRGSGRSSRAGGVTSPSAGYTRDDLA